MGNDEHDIGRVMGTPSGVCFVPYMEFPVPWEFLFSEYECHVFKCLFKLCSATMTIDQRHAPCYHGREMWDVHCHCESEGSLQCLASAKLVRGMCRYVIRGTAYNKMFPFYRYVANYHLQSSVRYVGSVHVNGVHLVYIHFKKESDIKYFNTSCLGPHKFIDCTLNSWLVLRCISCARLTEMQARVCARRTRLIIKKVSKSIARHRRSERKKSANINNGELLRQKMLTRLHRYGIVFEHEDYLLTV